jgi:hypothetical protein
MVVHLELCARPWEIPCIALPDELHDVIAGDALPLPPSPRDAFPQGLAVQLARYPVDARGPDLTHRLGRDLQRRFLKDGPLAVGGKYGRPDSLRVPHTKSTR